MANLALLKCFVCQAYSAHLIFVSLQKFPSTPVQHYQTRMNRVCLFQWVGDGMKSNDELWFS